MCCVKTCKAPFIAPIRSDSTQLDSTGQLSRVESSPIGHYERGLKERRRYVVLAQDTERIRIDKSDDRVRLTLTKVMKTDDGVYSCRLVNAAGETTAHTNLFVRQPVESVSYYMLSLDSSKSYAL